jgi:hypothetical protein
MFTRLLTVALLTAGTALAISTAQAQTSGSTTGSGSAGSTTMSPSTGGSSGSTSGSGSSGVTMGSGSASKLVTGSGSTQQAQQPMSGSFNASNYKTKTDCLNAASAQNADRTMCNSLK